MNLAPLLWNEGVTNLDCKWFSALIQYLNGHAQPSLVQISIFKPVSQGCKY